MPLIEHKLIRKKSIFGMRLAALGFYGPGFRKGELYFNAPHEFSQITMRDEKIYGIDFKHDGHYRLMYIDLGID